MKLAAAVTALLFLVGCVDPARVDQLEKRVSALETQAKERQAAATQNEEAFKRCVTVEADEAYWDFVRLNMKQKPDGSWWGPTYQWNSARQRKQDKIEECKLLYRR